MDLSLFCLSLRAAALCALFLSSSASSWVTCCSRSRVKAPSSSLRIAWRSFAIASAWLSCIDLVRSDLTTKSPSLVSWLLDHLSVKTFFIESVSQEAFCRLKRISTLVGDLFTFWPPGPDAPEVARISSSDTGMCPENRRLSLSAGSGGDTALNLSSLVVPG